ncbi:MAG: glycoside hydrolase family 57 protein [Phycisphaerales bacterium]|nr:glycoside hydrolase family 57 protein [Phycisphaerales bacterium]
MASICFYFQVHQPFRLRRYSIFDSAPDYFDDHANGSILNKVADKCYLTANKVIYDLVKKHNGRFRVSYSITGVAIEQFQKFRPEVLDTFKRLADTGCVEFLSETHYHSLSFLYSRREWIEQIEKHKRLMQELFGQTPTVFRNTELTYNNEVAKAAYDLGYKAVLCEGADHLLGYRSPTYLYHPPGLPQLKLLLKNYRLSDDIAFRFGNRGWADWPLTTDKFARWVQQVNGNGYVVNLFMDYETFGEHQWADTGIFDFLWHRPDAIFAHSDLDFKTPSECADAYAPSGEYDVPFMISWADTERDLSAWLGNAMQANALHETYRVEEQVRETGDPRVLDDWRRLTTSDHFYYMCTKYFADGDVHKYFNPYDSPYDSYINFMNVLDNLRSRLRTKKPEHAPGSAGFQPA